MANFLLMPFGSSGDTHPFLGIGRELRRRGHGVTVFVNGYFRLAVERAGLEYVEAGSAEDYLRMLDNPDIWDPNKGFESVIDNPLMQKALRAQFDLIDERFRFDPQLTVLAGSLAMGARIAEEKLGVKLVSLALQPIMFFSAKHPPVTPRGAIPAWLPRPLVRLLFSVIDTFVFGPVVGRVVEPLRRELGLPKATRYLLEWIHSPKLEIGLFPKWFGYEADWPPQLRLTGFPLFDDGADQTLSADVEDYLAQGSPPIVCTFGSGMKHGEKLFAAAAEACEQLGRRAILLTPFREQLPVKLPPQAAHFSYIPLTRLLPRAAAIVHHGGIGTMSQALRAGIPQIVIPLSHDQPDNADRAARLGVARSVASQKFSGKFLADALSRVLDNAAVLRACADVAHRFEHHDGIVETCDMIETFSKTGEAPSNDSAS